jgi:hypothetical protein
MIRFFSGHHVIKDRQDSEGVQRGCSSLFTSMERRRKAFLSKGEAH